MLITTYAGLVVNSDHVAYLALKRCDLSAADETPPASSGSLHRVLLCLAGGDHVVAATELDLVTAQRLRQELARRWAEGITAFDVTQALERLCDTNAKGEN